MKVRKVESMKTLHNMIAITDESGCVVSIKPGKQDAEQQVSDKVVEEQKAWF